MKIGTITSVPVDIIFPWDGMKVWGKWNGYYIISIEKQWYMTADAYPIIEEFETYWTFFDATSKMQGGYYFDSYYSSNSSLYGLSGKYSGYMMYPIIVTDGSQWFKKRVAIVISKSFSAEITSNELSELVDKKEMIVVKDSYSIYFRWINFVDFIGLSSRNAFFQGWKQINKDDAKNDYESWAAKKTNGPAGLYKSCSVRWENRPYLYVGYLTFKDNKERIYKQIDSKNYDGIYYKPQDSIEKYDKYVIGNYMSENGWYESKKPPSPFVMENIFTFKLPPKSKSKKNPDLKLTLGRPSMEPFYKETKPTMAYVSNGTLWV